MSEVEIVHSECSQYLDQLEKNSLDACITDPPYELGFMSQDWDRSGISFDPAFWDKVKRVLKPGAHIAVFGGSRTFHRIAVGIEDAGFQIRDTIDWVYGSGFPKNHDVSKAIDKKLGKLDEREKDGLKSAAQRKDGSMVQRGSYKEETERPGGWKEKRDPYKWKAATEEAEKYDGYGTALKPAKEPIIIARKPIDGTIAENVLKYGTGAINIDGCRTPVDPNDENIRENYEDHERETGSIWDEAEGAPKDFTGDEGRYPANLILDRWAAEKLDEQSGDTSSSRIGNPNSPKRGGDSEPLWGMSDGEKTKDYRDSGGASRYFKTIDYHPIDSINFFYCPKVSKKERNIGGKNEHMTVKPVELIAYLIRLLTPENGTIIDPFAGSGTTGVASILEDFDSILVEMDEDFVDICKKRVNYTKNNFREIYRMIYKNASNSKTEETAREKETLDHNFWE